MTKRTALDFADAKPFEIFRTGTHTPMNGAAIPFAEADLQSIADAYDPALFQAPIVVGHPKLDAPAYGWVGALTVEGDRLAAVPEQVDPAFAELVRSGRFKTVSASFYRPGQTSNPKPEGYYLRHVGFLGAQPPAVKGLKPASFAAGDDEYLTIEFGDGWAMASGIRVAGGLFRRLRDYLIGSAGLDVADRVLPDWDVQSLADLPAEIDPPSTDAVSPPSIYAEPKGETMPTAAELEAREEGLRKRQAELDARDAAFAETNLVRRKAEDVATLDGLVQAGRLPKVLRPIADALFAEIRTIETTVDFADGETTVQATPRDLLGRLLAALPVPVPTGELAYGEAAIDTGDPTAIAAAITDAAAKNGGDVLKGLSTIRGRK